MAASAVRTTTPFPSYQEPEMNTANTFNGAPIPQVHRHNSWGATDPWVNAGMEYQFPASQNKHDYGQAQAQVQAQDQNLGKTERLVDVTPLPDQPTWGNQDYAAQVPVADGGQLYGNADDQSMLGGMDGNVNAWGATNMQEIQQPEFQYQTRQPSSPLPTQYQLNKPARGRSTMQNAENVIQLRIQNAVLQNELRHARFAKDEAVQSSVLITRSLARVIPQVQTQTQTQSQTQGQMQYQTQGEQRVYVPRQYPAPTYPPGLVQPQPQQQSLVPRTYPAPKYPPGLVKPQAQAQTQQNVTIDRRLTVPAYPPSLAQAQQQQHIIVDRPYPAPAFPPGLPQPQQREHVQRQYPAPVFPPGLPQTNNSKYLQRQYPAPPFPPGLTKPQQPANEQYTQTQTQAAESSTDNAIKSLRSSLESMQKELFALRSENSDLKDRMRSMIEIPDGAQKIMLVDGSLLDMETLSMEAERVSGHKTVEHKEFEAAKKLDVTVGDDEYVSPGSPTKKPRRRVGEGMRDHRLSNQANVGPRSGLATSKGVFDDEITSISAASLTESRTPPLPPPQLKFWKPDTSRVSVQGTSWHDDDVFAPAPGEKGKELGDLGMHSLDDILGSDSGESEDDVSMPTTPGKGSQNHNHTHTHKFSADAEIKEGQFQTVDISRYQNMKFPSPKIEKTGFEIEHDKVVKGREYDFEKEKKAESELSKQTRALIRARVGDPPRMGGRGDHHFTRDSNRFNNTSFASTPELSHEISFDLPSDHDQSGLWNSREERHEAFVTHKQLVVRSRGTEPVFPDLFRYGIQYVPAEADGNYIRGVIITDLPKDIEMRDILARVRGGEIVSAVLMDTIKLTGGMSALVVFVVEGAAAEYVEYTTSYPISFTTESCPTPKKAKTWIIKTPTFPMNAPMKNRIHKHGQTRCLLISNLATPIDHNEIHHLTRDLAGGGVNKPGNTHRAESLIDVFVDDEEGSIKLEFATITMAGSSYGMLTAFRHYRHLAVRFVEDPCSGPLSDLSAPVRPRKPDHNRLTLYRPQDFVSPFPQEPIRPTPLVLRSSSSERESFTNRMRSVRTNGDLWKSLADSPSVKKEKSSDEVGDSEGDAILKKSNLKLRPSPIEIPSYGGSWADEMMEEAQGPTNTTPDTTSQPKGDSKASTPTPSTPGLSPSDSLTPILIDVLTPKTSSQEPKARDEEKENISSRRLQPDYGGFRKPPVGLAGSKYATAVPSFSDDMPTPTAHPRSRGENGGVTPRAPGLSREGSKLRFGVSVSQNEGLLIDTSVRSAVKQRKSEEDLKEAFGIRTPVTERPLIDASIHTVVKRRKSEEDLKEAFGIEPPLIDTSTRSAVQQRKSEDDLKEAFDIGTQAVAVKTQSKIISAKQYLQQLKEQEFVVEAKMWQQNGTNLPGNSASWTSQQAHGSGAQKRKRGFESGDPRIDAASRDYAQVDELFAAETAGEESNNPDEISLSDTEDEREINIGHVEGVAVKETQEESLIEQDSGSPYEISLPDSEDEDQVAFEHIEKREDIVLPIDGSI